MLTNKSWYGALYYKIIHSKKLGSNYYTLLGWDGNNNLTKAQKFTAQQIANHQSQKLLNQHLSPNLSNVLIRLPLERWQMSQGGQLVLMPPYNTSSGGRGMGRRYYGPVTIKRLHIKIVDDHGDTLDLTQGNVSFSLLLERLYQY